MDHAAFLYNIRVLPEAQRIQKLQSLEFSWRKVSAARPEVSFGDFITAIPTTFLNTQFGSEGEDLYCTTVLGAASYFQTDVDPVVACTLNRIVLELNFQTRFLGTGLRAETFLLDGNDCVFPFAMANGNVVAGIKITNDPTVLPEWASGLSHIEYQNGNLFSAPLHDVARVLHAQSRSRIGCLAMVFPLPGLETVNPAQRYAHLAEYISGDTYQIFAVPLWMGVSIIKSLRDKYPSGRVIIKIYMPSYGRGYEAQTIIIVTGIPNAVDIDIPQSRAFDCVFESIFDLPTSTRHELTTVKYFVNERDDLTERIILKPPVAIRASAPLPFECRERITDYKSALMHDFPHRMYRIPKGKLASIAGSGYMSHVYMNREYAVLKELCDASGIEFSDLYKASVKNSNGKKVGRLSINHRICIDGPAMPLTFTPDLHTYHSHFLIQCLPRILVYRELLPDGKIIVPPNLRKKQLEMLYLLGITEDKLCQLPIGAIAEADELYVPQPWPLVFSPYTLRIYDELLHKVPKVLPPTRRVLISREQRTSWRNMLTYDLVKQTLVENYGFEIIRPEKLSLAEEIGLYSNIEIMAGAEGAGLYSAVFAKPGSTFISIGDEDYIMPVLASAAHVRGFDVAYAFGESMRSDYDVERRKPFGHSDFIVNPAIVSDIIEEVLAKNSPHTN